MRAAFTLFEVAIAALIIALSVLTLALFLPIGIKAQQKSRFEVYAATKALDLVEFFVAQGGNIHSTAGPGSGSNASTSALQIEADLPWDSIAAYRAFSPDIEAVVADMRGAAYPLPTRIAERLTSANDEIRRILADGGQLYYAAPRPTEGIRPDANFAVKPPSESQRLVFAFTGYAQQNAVPLLPWKAAPYYAPYPSPPMVSQRRRVSGQNYHPATWELGEDSDIAFVYEHDFGAYDGAGVSGYRPYFGNFAGAGGNLGAMVNPANNYGEALVNRGRLPWLGSKHYVALALWYAYRKDVPLPFILGNATDADIDMHWDDPDLIRAMRFLAHAGMTLTKWYPLDGATEQPSVVTGPVRINNYGGQQYINARFSAHPDLPGLRTGVPIPGDELTVDQSTNPIAVGGGSVAAPADSPVPVPRPSDLSALYASLPMATIPALSTGPLPGHFYVTQAMIANWHEMSLRLGMRFAAEKPYDWRVLRPLNRAIMMDHPLIQFDLVDSATRPRLNGIITGTDGDPNVPGGPVPASQWRPIAASDQVQAGRNARGHAIDWDTIKGDIRHFSLTTPFSPSERCRQMVFWAVDWHAYEDFETAPSAAVDASRYPRASPGYHNESTAGRFTSDYMRYVQFNDMVQPRTRNPEKFMLFLQSLDHLPTGDGTRYWTLGADLGSEETWNTAANAAIGRWDMGYNPLHSAVTNSPRAIFSGIYGADRNWNQRLDRGPLQTHVHLRAQEIARFNFYDPRLALSLR